MLENTLQRPSSRAGWSKYMPRSQSRQQVIRDICEQQDLRTHDPYDFWMTAIGFRIKDFYNHHRVAGLPAAAAFALFDLYLNDRPRIGYPRREYPIVRALAAQALLLLYRRYPDPLLLSSCRQHLEWLRSHTCGGYGGPCWGLGFRYAVSKDLVYPPDMPLTTMTPYALEAFIDYASVTGDQGWNTTIRGVFEFLENDVVVLEETDDFLVTSYAALRDRRVINAVSYVMYSYALLLPYIEPGARARIIRKIEKLFNYVVTNQLADGSWLYSPEPSSFIDCFHSCIVLKNLLKTKRIVELGGCDEVVARGYGFLKREMYVPEVGLFKRFAKSNKPGLIRFDLYDNAEMLQLAHLMGDDAFADALEDNIARLFVRDGTIFSHVDRFGLRLGPDRLRWAVLPYIYALALRESALPT
jgi:hypothetical protein